MEEVVKIITKFLSKYNSNEIEGILLYGSAVSGKMDDKSDIDLLIATNTHLYEDVVGCTLIDNTKVEYFIHNIDNLYELALKQIEKNDPSRLTKFITSKIIYDKNGNFTKEIDKIRKLYDLPIKKERNLKNKKTIFHIKNRIDDLHSLIETDTFFILYFDILKKIKVLNTKLNGYIIIPLGKTEKLFKDSNYMKEYIKSDIHKVPEEEFKRCYLECLKIKEKKSMIEDIEKLFNYVIKNEEFDPDNFELVFESGEIEI